MSASASNMPIVENHPCWTGYTCVVCGRTYPADYADMVCADCGIDGILDATYDHAAIADGLARERERSGVPFPPGPASGMWRFAALLPVHPRGDCAAWTLGASPLHRARRLAEHLGLRDLILKDDTHLPSASLKDRAAAMAIARARQLGVQHLACASTGNAAASLAVLCARASLSCRIYVPETAPRAKLAQLLLHGADVVPVRGTYDQAFELSLVEMARHGWYSRNCAHNPLLVEGKKTATLELLHDLTAGFTRLDELPDVMFVPVGDGCIVSSTAKALWELRTVGLIPSLPRVIGVQAAGAAPLADAWRRHARDAADLTGPEILAAVAPVTPRTLADSISVGIPRNRVKAWRYVARTGGAFLAVSDEAIVEAIGLLAAKAGVFAEPSGAAGLAGIKAAQAAGLLAADERVAVLVTGNGLKDPEAALGSVVLPPAVDPLTGRPV